MSSLVCAQARRAVGAYEETKSISLYFEGVYIGLYAHFARNLPKYPGGTYEKPRKMCVQQFVLSYPKMILIEALYLVSSSQSPYPSLWKRSPIIASRCILFVHIPVAWSGVCHHRYTVSIYAAAYSAQRRTMYEAGGVYPDITTVGAFVGLL